MKHGSINFSEETLAKAKLKLTEGIDTVNIPTSLELFAYILRDDVQAAVDDKEADPEYCERLLKVADDMEHIVKRRFSR